MKTTMFVLSTLVLCAPAFAGQKLSYAQVKEGCLNPVSFHNQIKPANMEVSCTDVQTRWELVGPGTYTLPRARKVTMGMTSDKYDVAATAKDVAIEQATGPCPRYKEITERVQTTRATTCEEILGFQGNEIQFCTGVIDAYRAANRDAINSADSGRIVQVCSPSIQNGTPVNPGK